MCRMTDTSFRWQMTVPLPLLYSKWYVYERAPGELRYSQMRDDAFNPLYAINVTSAITPLRERMANRIAA